MPEQQSALKTRDLINRIVKKIIDSERPLDRYAEVTSISPGLATVIYVGEEAKNEEHTVKVGAIQPSYVGQRVRIGGPPGDRWVVDVIGQALVNYGGNVAENLQVPTGVTVTAIFRKLLVQWTGSVAADLYEIQIASDVGFTSIEATYQTTATQFQTPTDFTLGTHYVRVRAATGSSVSEWSDSDSATIVPTSTVSDGFPPDESPDVFVTPALGFIKAEWLPVPNNDTVTYSVHASLESGFTPTADNKITETTLTFHIVSNFKNGDRLPYDSPTFVRVVASDQDGSASPGAQGFGTPNQVETGDAGNLQLPGVATDGLPPTYSPEFTVKTGLGFAYFKWDHVINDDAMAYELHISTVSTAYPTANTLVVETPSNFVMVSSAGGPDPLPLQTGAVYYARVHAKDADGYAAEPWPPRSSAGLQFSTGRVGLGDVETGAIFRDNIYSTPLIPFIAVNSALIENGAIGEAHIGSAAITSAKINQLDASRAAISWLDVETANIKDLAVKGAKIANASITSAKIDNAQLETAEISWLRVGDAHITSLSADKVNAGSMTADRVTSGTLRSVTIDATNTITGALLRTGVAGPRAEVRDKGMYFYSNNMNGAVPGGLQVDDIRLPFIQGGGPNGTAIRLSPPKHRTTTVRAPTLTIFDSTSHGGVAEFINTEVVRVPSGSLSTPGLEFGMVTPANLDEQGPGGAFKMGFYQDTNDVSLNYAVLGQRMMKLGLDQHQFWFGAAQGGNPPLRSVFEYNSGNQLVYYYMGSVVWSQSAPVSDIRKKVNISNIDDQAGSEERALEIIRRVRTIDFEYDPARNAYPAGKRWGVVAQDIKKVFPQGVTVVKTPDDPFGDEDTLMLDSPNLISLLWRAVLELDRKIA